MNELEYYNAFVEYLAEVDRRPKNAFINMKYADNLLIQGMYERAIPLKTQLRILTEEIALEAAYKNREVV